MERNLSVASPSDCTASHVVDDRPTPGEVLPSSAPAWSPASPVELQNMPARPERSAPDAPESSSQSIASKFDEFGKQVELGASRRQHFALMKSVPDGPDELSSKFGQVGMSFSMKFDASPRAVPQRYSHPGGIEKIVLGNVDVYFQKAKPLNGPIAFFAHGMNESRKIYAPSADQSDSMRAARQKSRGDEALSKGFHVAAISFKGGADHARLVPTNTDLANAVVAAVRSYADHLAQEGAELDAANIVLVGKSRGTKAVLAGVAQLRRDGIGIDRVILESPILDAKSLRLTEAFKGKPAYGAVSRLKDDFDQNHLRHDRDYDLETSLNDLCKQLDEDGGTVTIKVLKAENDSTVGDVEANQRIRDLLFSHANVIAYGSSSEDGANVDWHEAGPNERFLKDGSPAPRDAGRRLFVEFHHVPGSQLHGQNKLQLPLNDGRPEGGFDELTALSSKRPS